MISILVADDAPNVRKLLGLILGPLYEVIEAGDGDQALRMLVDHQPDIALLDVSMPGQTGIDVCRQLRQDTRLAATGVIMITANGMPLDRTTALDAGADYFLTKPFSPAELLSLVQSLILARAAVATEG